MTSNLVRGDVMLAIAVMTAVTVALRLGGFWLMGYVTVTPRVRRMLAALPGSGWEVSLIWPVRFGAFIGSRPETNKGPATACPGPSGPQ